MFAQVPERPAHPGDQRRDDVADRFVAAPREKFLEHAVQLCQLALDQPADGPAARQLHRARRGVEPNAAAIGAHPLREQPPIRLLARARDLVFVLVDVQPVELAGDAFEGPLVRRALVDLLDPPSNHSRRSRSAAVNPRSGLRGGTTFVWTISRQYQFPMS